MKNEYKGTAKKKKNNCYNANTIIFYIGDDKDDFLS